MVNTAGTAWAGLLLAAAWVSGAGCADRSTQEACAEANAQAEWTTAVELCHLAWRQDAVPQDAYRWARAAARNGDITPARTLLTELDDRSIASARTRYLVAADLYAHNKLDEAEVQFTRSLSVFEQHGDARRASVLARTVASLRRKAGRYADAEGMMFASMAHAERVEDKRLVFEVLLELGALYGELGRAALARSARDQAIELFPGDPLSDTTRAARAFDAGRFSVSETLYRRALRKFGELRDWKAQRITALHLVDLALLQEDSARAHEYLSIAVEARKSFTNGAPVESLPPNTRSSELYYAASVALADGEVDNARSLLAKARAQPLGADWPWQISLLEGKAHAARGEPQLALEAAFEALDDHESEPSGDVFATADRMRRRREAVGVAAKAAHELADVQALLRLVDRLHLQLREHQTALALDEVEAALGERSALAYVVVRDALFVATWTGRDWRFSAVRIPQVEIERLTALFIADLDPQIGAQLADLLLPHDLIQSGLDGELFIVPDASLDALPWAALPISDGWLVERADLVLMPSLRPSPHSQAHGPPTFVTDPHGDLPRARTEGQTWGPRLSGFHHFGGAATLGRLEGLRTELLHLAVHSGHSDGQAWVSLADGRVSARKLAELNIDARAVVLATCASTTARSGDIWTSVPGVFLVRGSDLVVGTLWSVKDASAERFVQALYEREETPLTAAAVSSAQRALIAEGAPPREWAAYTAMGHLFERNEDTQ